MNPDTPIQPNGVGQAQPTQLQGQSLDPSVVALTKAIGKAESGGKYNSTSMDSGSPKSAYQFTPGFLKEWGPKAGIQYQDGVDLTPEQQDKIAYNAVQTMGTQGSPAYPHLGKLTPAQIASAWNAGNPNAYLDPEYGKNNAYGSVENYVNKVGEYFNEYNGSPTQPQGPQTQYTPKKPQGDDLFSSLEGLGAGALGWLAGNAGTVAKIGLPIAGAALGTMIEPGVGTMVGEGLGAGVAGLIPTGENSNQRPSPVASGEPTQSPSSFRSDFQQSASASNAVKNAIMEAMQGTQGNRVFSQSQPGQQAVNTAAQFGLIEPDENGNLTFNEAKQKQALGEISELHDKVIGANGGTASPVKVLNETGNYLGKDKLLDPTSKREAAEKIQKLFADDRGGIPTNGEMSLATMRERQKQHYKAAENAYKKANYASSPEQIAHKALGHSYGAAIRDKMDDKELYDKTKLMESNLINAKQVGKRLNGKKAPKTNGAWETFIRGSAKYAEAYIGEKLGGPIGAVIGMMAGEKLNSKIDKKFGRNIFETPGMVAALDILRDAKPKEYGNIVEALSKQGIDIHKEVEPDPDTRLELKHDLKDDIATMKGKVGLIKVSK